MTQLLVTLSLSSGANGELPYALVSSAGVLAGHGLAAPALMPKADQATLIVPPQALSWHLASLPKLSRGSSAQKAEAMLAGVLEEQLLEDTSQIHLAACPTLKQDGKTWVAACDKNLLKEIVELLRAARVPLTRIVPQVFPGEASSLHVSGTPESAWVTFVDVHGVLTLPLSQSSMLPNLPEAIAPSAEPGVAAVAEQALQQQVSVLQAAQWALEAAQAAQSQGVDLAQGDLALSGGGRAWQLFTGFMRDFLVKPAWQPARWGLVLLLLANVVGLNAWAFKQSQAVRDKRNQMNQLLTQSFPNVTVVVDAPLQMQRELANLRQAQGQLSGRDFESIYGRFSSVAGMNTAPSAIDFVVNEVQIRGSGLSASQLDALLPRFQYAGLTVRSDAQALVVSHRDAATANSIAANTASAGVKP